MTLIAVSARAFVREWERSQRKQERESRVRSKLRGHLPYSEYPFIMWDGEAPKDTGYSLFGSSAGHELCRPHLDTEECLDLLLSAKRELPESIFTIFGGRYDFDEILRQSMPLDRLSRLKKFGSVFWHGYKIKQAEGKYITITKKGISVTVYEIFGWFHKSYVKALMDYQIGPWGTDSKYDSERHKLETGKSKRAEFLWADIEDIREYMHLELKYGPRLMDKIREIVLAAGFNPRAWYGPSALALEALRKNKVHRYIGRKNVPPQVRLAAQYAYAGGRFEDFRGGILSPVYSYDKNSAYMAAALDCPDLEHGTWRRGKAFEPGKFAVYHIRYDGRSRFLDSRRTEDHIRQQMFPWPLWCRYDNGSVAWVPYVEGWYWQPEAELVANDPCATFIESWVFDAESEVRPLAFVQEWYRKRMLLESLPAGNPSRKAGKAFKWALASVYGQLCRAIGFDTFRKLPPRYHCLEWAGYITSHCRAAMQRLADSAGDKLISIDTDSVTAMCPLEVDEGKGLGQWKAEHFDSGIFYQSGVYAVMQDGEWVEQKSRGMEEDQFTRRVPVSPEMMISAMYEGRPLEMKPRTRYVSVRMALNHQLAAMGDWREHPGDKLTFGGNGKRVHRKDTCKDRPGTKAWCPSDESHIFRPRPAFTHDNFMFDICPVSRKHKLPWIDGMDSDNLKLEIADLLWIDPELIDEEDRWIISVR